MADDERDEDEIIHIDLRPLKDYAAPVARNAGFGFSIPDIGDRKFVIPAPLINMLRNNQFRGAVCEDPNEHLENFLEICDTQNFRGISKDALRLRLFSMTLLGKARKWIRNLDTACITSWAQCEAAFLDYFFPPSRTDEYRRKIDSFYQEDGETFAEAWDRFSGYLAACPHHGVDRAITIHTFYNGLHYASKLTLHNAAGGAFMNKPYPEALKLIEGTAENERLWVGDSSGRRRMGTSGNAPGKYQVSSNDFLLAKVEALNAKLDKLGKSGSSSSGPSAPVCGICSVQGHSTFECKVGGEENEDDGMENVASANNWYNTFDRKDRFEQPPTYFSERTRHNHPNFSYWNDPNSEG